MARRALETLRAALVAVSFAVSPALAGDTKLAAERCKPEASAVGATTSADAMTVWGTRLTESPPHHDVRPGENLTAIGARHGVSATLIARDNAISASALLMPGTALRIDARHIAPDLISDGILINVPQRMLFHFGEGRLLAAYPVAVGKPGWPTPTGAFHVVTKQTEKPWIVPPSIQREMAREGKPVLTRVEAGPENPLGKHWIGLSIPGIGIHGTIAPSSIYGLRSHGCIRLHPDDVASLYAEVSPGTPGRIVYHPTLLAVLRDGRVFLEVNRDAYRRAPRAQESIEAAARERGITDRIDWSAAARVIRDQDGIARDVTRARQEEGSPSK